jgi:hypothetical protein
MGNHFRECVYQKNPDPKDIETRRDFQNRLELFRHERAELKNRLAAAGAMQREVTRSETMTGLHTRRREIEREAELRRLHFARNAIISSYGLEAAHNRPSAWWIPLVSPDGKWFQAIMQGAKCCWEHIS